MDHEAGLTLVELADGVSVQEVVEATECEFQVSCNQGFSQHKRFKDFPYLMSEQIFQGISESLDCFEEKYLNCVINNKCSDVTSICHLT